MLDKVTPHTPGGEGTCTQSNPTPRGPTVFIQDAQGQPSVCNVHCIDFQQHTEYEAVFLLLDPDVVQFGSKSS